MHAGGGKYLSSVEDPIRLCSANCHLLFAKEQHREVLTPDSCGVKRGDIML